MAKRPMLSIRLSASLDEKLNLIATKENKTKSEVARKLLELGADGDLYRHNETEILANMKRALEEVLKPSINRLAAIAVKGTITSASSYFLSAIALSAFVHPSMRPDFNEAVVRAKKMGVEYTRIKDVTIDEFLDKGIEKLNNRYLSEQEE